MLLHEEHTSFLPLKLMQQLQFSSKVSGSGPEVFSFSPVMSLPPILHPPAPGIYLWWGMCSAANRHRKMQFGRGWSWKLWRDFFFLHTFRKKRRGQKGRIKRGKEKKEKRAGTYWVQSCIRLKQTIEHSSEGWLDRTKPDSIYCLLWWCARNAGAVVILN